MPATTRAKVSAAGVVFLAVLAASPLAARADFTPGAGTVVVSDKLGRRDLVTFYFPGDARAAGDQVRQAAAAAGLPIRGLTVDAGADDGLVHVRLTTTVGRRTGFFSRRLEARVLQALDVSHQGSLVVSLHPGARVDGHPRVVDHGVFSRKIVVSTADDVAYRVPPAWLTRVLALLLVVVGLPFVVLRAWALRLERRPGEDVDKVHRLRVGLTVAYCLLPIATMFLVVISGVLLLPDMVLSEVAPSLTAWRATSTVALLLLIMGSLIVTDVAAYMGAQPVDRRLRDTDDTALSAGRRFARALVIGFVPLSVWLVFVSLTPGMGPAGRLVGLLVFLLVMNIVGPVLVTRAQETYRLDDPLRRRLLGLCDAQGLRVRDVRGIRSRSARVANAMITGLLPSLRYVLITDHLIDNLSEDELDAILAHEIAHGRQHHLLIKTGSWVGMIVVFELAIALAGAAGAALSLLPIIGFVALFLAYGRVGVVLEQKADDYACEQMGAEPVVRALEKLARLNMLKRRTGAVWDALQQHPGVERRITRLQSRGGRVTRG